MRALTLKIHDTRKQQEHWRMKIKSYEGLPLWFIRDFHWEFISISIFDCCLDINKHAWEIEIERETKFSPKVKPVSYIIWAKWINNFQTIHFVMILKSTHMETNRLIFCHANESLEFICLSRRTWIWEQWITNFSELGRSGPKNLL